MTGQALFGQGGVNASSPTPQPVTMSLSPTNDETTPLQSEEIPDIRFGMPYAEGKSTFITILLWLFMGGSGAHRFYLGHKLVGAALLVTGLIGMVLIFSALVTVVSTYKADGTVALSGLVSFAAVSLFHMGWTLVDGPYVLIRKLASA